MIDALILAVCTIAGFGIGAAALVLMGVADSFLVLAGGLFTSAMFALIGGVVGTLTRSSLRQRRLRKQKAFEARSRTNNKRPQPVGTHRSYRSRLAHFVDRPEDQVMSDRKPFRSRMLFWSLAGPFVRRPSKSAALIRFYLEQIRATLRGNGKR